VAELVAVLGLGVVDPRTPVVRADDAGLARGDGCFEGCRVLVDPSGHATVDKLDAHLARMGRSATALGIPFEAASWHRFVDEALRGWRRPGEWRMALTLTRGIDGVPTGLLTVASVPAYYPAQRQEGVSVITLSRGTLAEAHAEAPWLLGGVKTLSYAVNMAAQREAARRGADDVIFHSADGMVLEAPTSSVVWSTGDTLHTTPLGASGVLGGTTQALLFERAAAAGWRTGTRAVGVQQLHTADSLWLIGTVRGPVDVIELDGKPRGRDEARTAAVRALCGF
jgi:4-amino-4-deoxychorismate lyase